MRTRKRSAIALAAGITSIALLAAGCSSASDKPAAGASKSASAGTSTEKVTLSVATFNEFGYEDLYTEYMKLHPNVTIEARKAATSNEARDKLNTAIAAGSGAADIEGIEVDWLPELMQVADKFVDLKDPSVEGRWLQWKTDSATTPDGQLMGYGTDVGPEGICYRADLFKDAGLPSDRDEVAKLLTGDWENYFAKGRDFVAKSDAAWFDSAGATFQGMVNQIAEPYEKADGTVIGIENPEIKSAYDAVLKASVTDDLSAHLGQWSDDWNGSFQKDKFATMLCPGWMLGVVSGNAKGVKGWDFADVFPGGGGNWGGSFLTVPKQGKHAEAAKALANWLTAPEQQIKAFVAKGTFPSQVEALKSTDLLGQKNEFFNNAPTGQILANRAAAITVAPFKGASYFAIHTTVTDAIARVDVDKTDDAAKSWEKAKSAYAALGLG